MSEEQDREINRLVEVRKEISRKFADLTGEVERDEARQAMREVAEEIARTILRPPWGADDMPKTEDYTKEEQEIASALHLMHPFNGYHLRWTLPYARTALEAKQFMDYNNTEGYIPPKS